MKVLGRFNPLDFICLLVILIAGAGALLAKAGYAGVDQVITGKANVNIDVYFVGVKTKDPEMFKKGDKAALTIRNQPLEPSMTITAVKHWPKQTSYVLPSGKVISADDPAAQFAHDFLVTVSTDPKYPADRTKDGFVVCGQKIKVGNQAELESFNYRVQGVVIGITPQ